MNDNAKAWVAALRSGEYEQGIRRLHTERDGVHTYCCLGVACELAVEAGITERQIILGAPGYGLDLVGRSSSLLPPEVQEWLGLQTADGAFEAGEYNIDTLTELNDGGADDFDDIADLIESEPYGLFE